MTLFTIFGIFRPPQGGPPPHKLKIPTHSKEYKRQRTGLDIRIENNTGDTKYKLLYKCILSIILCYGKIEILSNASKLFLVLKC